MFGVSSALFDFSVIRPLLSGLSAIASNVTPSAPALAFSAPSAKTACGAQRSSRSGASGPEELSLMGAP